MSTSSKVRFAVVGAGVIGDVHARAIRSLPEVAELRLVVSTREATARRLAEAQGATGWSTDYQAMLADPEIDAVSICTPSGTHADLAVAALQAGRHVMVEKPIDVSLEAADRVLAAERASGKKVAVVSQHRFDPSTEQVIAAIEAGDLGRLTSGIASTAWWRGQSYYDSGRWRGTWAMDGGGAIMNQTIHTIDLLVAMLGVPTEVFAYAARLAHERVEVEDTAVAVVRFAGGALGMIHGTTAAYPGLDAGVRVFGTKGSAVISDDQLVYFHHNPGPAPELTMPLPMTETNQITGADTVTADRHGLGAAHVAQFADFVDAIRSERPVRVGTREARAVLAVVLGLYQSAASGTPVPIEHG
ncbi:MAG TPA: Gfo/Idh/MocA family oxidoreductase [Actinomycetota bacterium]|jgi:predicted dehydrogenase|nr:Gfo/Idh/MocA family oxidoreductase [Actinomycetota bacterium]